jgi:biotin carboxyl carrier protein
MTPIVLPDTAWKGVEPGTEAIVEKWLVDEGERVDAGQVVATTMLIKASLDVVAPVPGIVDKILVAAEESFARGQPLAMIRER